MSAYCPEGVLTCRDAEAGPCVVGYPCELHPSQTQADGGEEWVTGVELHCDDCQKPYARWFADSPEWNLVMGGPEAKDDPGGMLCPRCFTLRAEKVYTLPVWRLWLDRENRVKVSCRDASHAEQLAQAREQGAAEARARVEAALVQVGYLDLVAKQIREQGDVAQVLMDGEGVGPTHSLADELWMIAFNLRAALDGGEG